MPERLRPFISNVGDHEIHGLVAASDEPSHRATVVLVHGLAMSSTYLAPLGEALAQSYDVYIPELPGFGRSSKPEHVLNVSELADALAQWIKQADIKQAVLLGNSLGCQIIAELTVSHPHLVSRAVLIGPTMDPIARGILHGFLRLVIDTTREPISFLPIMLRDYLAAGPVRTLQTARFAMHDRIEDKLPRIDVPTLVVRGGRDPIVPQTWTKQVCRLLPNGALETLAGEAHVANFSAPDILCKMMRTFMEGGLTPPPEIQAPPS